MNQKDAKRHLLSLLLDKLMAPRSLDHYWNKNGSLKYLEESRQELIKEFVRRGAVLGKTQRKRVEAKSKKSAPKRVLPKVAFEVTDKEEGSADIVWDTCSAAARRQMMGEFSCEFSDMSTKRVPELDNFTGDIDHWKWEHGWWSHCSHRECNEERVTEGDERSLYDNGFYCSPECRDKERVRSAEERAKIEAAHAEAQEILPGVVCGRSFVNVGGDVVLDMGHPGGEHFATTSLTIVRTVPEIRERWAREAAERKAAP